MVREQSSLRSSNNNKIAQSIHSATTFFNNLRNPRSYNKTLSIERECPYNRSTPLNGTRHSKPSLKREMGALSKALRAREMFNDVQKPKKGNWGIGANQFAL
jgi:hypothetical protein